jgi:ornithine decarboxylase
MGQPRFRAAVAPLRRGHSVPAPAGLKPPAPLPAVDELVRRLAPDEPLHCLRPATLRATAGRFVSAFAAAAPAGIPAEVLYAVKCNPEPAVLRALAAGGVRHFDCASPAEIRLVRQMFPHAHIHYMHPVKARRAIAEAWRDHGVRDFVLDSLEELHKILEETGHAPDLGLVVRIAMPAGLASYDLSAKFGAQVAEAAELLRRARAVAARVGLSFHVGSQCLDPGAYAKALGILGDVLRRAGVTPDIVDVGGGFPVSYADVTPPALEAYMAAIAEGVRALGLPAGTRLWCEPGRALVASGASVVVQVLRRRGDELFVNDGVYGSLFDAGTTGLRFPVRLVRPGAPSGAVLRPFSLWGPTCDSADRMAGPFALPGDAREGDWIEIGQTGAYGTCLRTAFNGFDRAQLAEVRDAPLLATAGHGQPGWEAKMA